MTAHELWWPPKIGDKLRHFTLHGSNGPTGTVQVDALCHVLAVFDHAGETHATVAEWFPVRRRWHYETISIVQAHVGTYWPDGTPRPRSF